MQSLSPCAAACDQAIPGAALAVAGMLMLLLLGFTQPDWAARGTLFLLLALAMLGAAGWFLRARLRLLRRMMD